MIRAGEDRKKENKDFQQTVADQCVFQKLLQAPPQHPEGILREEGGCTAPAGACWPSSPPGCKNYKKNVASGGVMGMIQRIMNDSKAMRLRHCFSAIVAAHIFCQNLSLPALHVVLLHLLHMCAWVCWTLEDAQCSMQSEGCVCFAFSRAWLFAVASSLRCTSYR